MFKLIVAKNTTLALLIAVAATVFGFQNCGGFHALSTTQVYAGSSYCQANASDPACTAISQATCTFNGSQVANNSSVTAYLASTDATCTPQTRTCTNGALSGNYTYAICATSGPAACLFNGATITSGASVTAYLASVSTTCTPQQRSCTNGALSGNYLYSTCSAQGALSCLFNGQTMAHGQSVTAYATSQVPYGQTCASTTRVCLNGALTGSGTYGTCTPAAPASCLFNGATIASGASTTAYATSTVSYGSTCQSETRTCTNGTLSGSDAYGSCVPAQPAACLINGQTIPSSGTITLYTTATGTWTSPCQAELRTCSNGSLSGSAANGSCTNPAAQANYTPQNKTITPFSTERLLTVVSSNQSAGQTGQWWCDTNFGNNFGGNWRCLEVSGGGTCATDVAANAAIACVQRAASQTVAASSGPTAGQTGQWWCDNNFGANLGGKWLCLGTTGTGSCSADVGAGTQIACRQLINPTSFTVPSGPTAGQTGQWWCENNNGTNGIPGQFQCASQTSPADCSANSNAGSVVTCERIRNGSGDGRMMNPDTSCSRSDLDPAEKEWCKNTPYIANRAADTTYISNRYTRVGVNRAYGGTIFEVYGTDFLNRFEEHGGSAIQLSVWGYDVNASGAAYFTTMSCNPTPFTDAATCQANNAGVACDVKAATGIQNSNCTTEVRCGGWSAGAPINPIQAQGLNCGWDRTSAAVDGISPISYGLHVGKTGPYNFTKSTVVSGMHWEQNVAVPENAPYAQLTYSMTYTGTALGFHNQEIPAIFTDTTLGAYYYFYEDGAAYTNSNSAVTRVTPSQINELALPYRTGDLPQPRPTANGHQATEEWMSSCDSSETHCVTIAAFASSASSVMVFETGGQYITPVGRFALSTGLQKSWIVYVFPYRFDNVVEGKSVRQWIYELR